MNLIYIKLLGGGGVGLGFDFWFGCRPEVKMSRRKKIAEQQQTTKTTKFDCLHETIMSATYKKKQKRYGDLIFWIK